MKPTLLAQPYAHWIADILTRFEDGKPLTCDQLNFLISHEKTLSNHALDLVLKYYLSSQHKEADKSLSFTIPTERIDHFQAHELRDAVKNLLKHELTHVDLKMSLDQFLQFKAVGLHELIFWHGPQFLSRTCAFPGAVPLVLYLQWGKLFGVVKLNSVVENFTLDGNILIYFEDMDDRNLNKCVLDYAQTHKIEYKPALIHTPEETLIDQPLHHLPTPRPGIYEMISKVTD